MDTETTNTDVKDTNTSSGVQTAQTQQTDTQTGQKSGESKEPTVLETAQRVFDEHAKKEATPKEVKNAQDDKSQSSDKDSKIQELNQTKKKEDVQDGEDTTKKGDNGEEGDKQGDELEKLAETKGPVPYQRWKPLYEESKALKAEVENSKPLVEGQKQIQDYCVKNQITPEQFSQGLELLALMNSNPQEAVKKLASIAGELQDMTGDRLPEDLAAEVASGDISENRAKELAKLRAQTKQGQQQQERSQATIRQEREQALIREVGNASNSWITGKQSVDPDFRPKANVNAVDGKYEWVREKYLAMTQQTDEHGKFVFPVRSAADVSKYLELAYNAVEKSLASFRPKSSNKGSKNLSANNSNGGQETEPTSILEIAKRVGAKHGINI